MNALQPLSMQLQPLSSQRYRTAIRAVGEPKDGDRMGGRSPLAGDPDRELIRSPGVRFQLLVERMKMTLFFRVGLWNQN